MHRNEIAQKLFLVQLQETEDPWNTAKICLYMLLSEIYTQLNIEMSYESKVNTMTGFQDVTDKHYPSKLTQV